MCIAAGKAKPNRRSPKSYRWVVRVQGNLSRVWRYQNWHIKKKQNKRSPITTFSFRSRMNMLRTSAKIDWSNIGNCSFYTLTYPDVCVETKYRDRGTHRYVFHRYLEKYFGCDVPALWRIEWKPRQTGMYVGLLMPHIHLIVMGLPTLGKDTVRSLWQSTLSYYDYIDVHSKEIYGAEGAAKYISKYMSKPDALGIVQYHNKRVTPGRAWGLNRKNAILWYPVSVCKELTSDQAVEVQQLAAMKFHWYDPEQDGGFTIFGKETAKILEGWYGKGLAGG